MILLVGLGNPGSRYADNRHNIGFQVVDELGRRARVATWRSGFSGHFSLVNLASQRALLLKPATFMNASGHSVRAALAFYKVEPEATLVVHDELDLPFGEIRLKRGGGDAGHNGLRSIAEQLGTREYLRLRFGIGHPPEDYGGTGADFVLQAFAPAEREVLSSRIESAADAVLLVLRRGPEAAMNQINRRDKRT